MFFCLNACFDLMGKTAAALINCEITWQNTNPFYLIYRGLF